MEKHKCKLCSRGFSNGRALGGHMRSHMLNLPVPARPELSPLPPPPPPPAPAPAPLPHDQFSETESASSPSSSSGEEEGGGEEKGLCYELRENPKRSIRLVDPEFSFAVDAGSVVLQDGESETESSKNPTRRRSKRTLNLEQKYHLLHHDHQRVQEQDDDAMKKLKFTINKAESWAEPEPVSSISDTTTEEDVAFCLMMLSRDKWKRQDQDDEDEDLEDESERSLEDMTDESEEQLKMSKTRTRGRYKCETCKKSFRSYQALGGHRASHKKMKLNSAPIYKLKLEQKNAGTPSMTEKKIHECPVCLRVFASGQALGGHKRTHVTGSARPPASVRSSTMLGQAFIDLNLPAPTDDDEFSQIELSAVSDAEFVNPH
ncbi:zinc finger protein ZAT9-like [Carya illinoinensis]|uniref:C2H2-type domain-containing protein n=1 Tax=Carya illinoinensis TaxID=32201 RepID=A0A8T1NFP2_CARIL|nr:zinc finger protein ZAT9-like [Carya illinoinensis]KAG6628611.1 hypothetical protein CIPAW_14G025100 [Carya illinoinensis]KAG6677453.1 hypothetical protein I3842_14G027700 [Carya illinoinensis]